MNRVDLNWVFGPPSSAQNQPAHSEAFTVCPAIFMERMTEAERHVLQRLYYAAFVMAKKRVEQNRARFERLMEDVNLAEIG